MVRGVAYVMSLLGTGGVVLFAVFTAIAGVSPAQAAAASAVAAVVAGLLAVRAVRLAYELRSQGGDPEVRAAYNRQRERRGF